MNPAATLLLKYGLVNKQNITKNTYTETLQSENENIKKRALKDQGHLYKKMQELIHF